MICIILLLSLKENCRSLRDALAEERKTKGAYVMYQWICDKHQEDARLSLSRLCSALGVSRSGYYDWLNRRDAPPPKKETELKGQIYKIVLEFPGYGYRRVTKELKRRDYLVNHKRVLRLMREENLLCRRNKRIFRTTDSSHNLPVYATWQRTWI